MGRIGCIRCVKSRLDFVEQTFALIALVHPILHRVSCSYETIPNAPKHYERLQNMSLGSNGWIRCVCWEKLQRDFVARTFALIAPVQYVLHQVSCSYETIPNAPKHYETHQNMCLWSNGVDQVRSLRKIQCDFVSRTFVLIEPVQYVLKQVSCSYGTIPNAPKYYEMHRNISLGSNGVDRVRPLQKIKASLHGTKFCINCTSSVCFAPTFMHLRNDPNCPQILRNAPKH